ncbi:Tetratricopeptide TPR2 [Penicillium chermesinum]|uniref:Tetratricopeptide TPR2 n=1 Tax=Penicillium chermesinum TaxID=63820 RepID=A0A9W9NYK3_9EURO|nr:Tetratricopeptide TPR2 [Penicillium chermesinum]KAJ5232010.1 Tetratricopeptide TPR2 [Penicillium chermesinum]
MAALGAPPSFLDNLRFSDIPDAIDIPASSFDSEVEVSLLDLPEDPTELCTLLENERAAKNFWVIIALAYAKRKQIDHAIDILNKGLASVAHSATKEKLGLLGWVCWLLMLKSRQAPRVAPEGELYSEAKTKDHYLQLATSTLNEASRLNPAYPPLFLARGVLCLLRASLYPPRAARPGVVDSSERVESLRQALKCFDESSKAFGGRNVMAILGRARAHYMLGRYGEALEGYQKVLMKVPNLKDPDPRIGLGCCMWQLGFKDNAKAAWERALALNPNSKVANILLAVYHLYDSSRRPTTDPMFGSLYKVAMTQYTQKAFKLDKEYPMTSIEQTDVMPIASDGWYLLGRKSHYENDNARAMEYYNRSDQARGGGDKGYLPAKFGAVQIQVSNKDYDGAKFRLEKIVQQSKNAEAMVLLAALHAEEIFAAQRAGSKDDKSNETKRAITLLESVRAMWKDEKQRVTPDESVLVYLSRLYETTAPEKSMQCLTQLEELQLSAIPETSRPEGIENEEDLKNALRENLPPQLLNNMGCFLYQSEKIALARGMFQSALNACVQSEETETKVDNDAIVTTVSYNLARTYEAADMWEEAKKIYEGVLERHKDYTDASARLTYISLRQSPTDQGPKNIAKLFESEPSNLEVRALFGWYASKSKKRGVNLAEDPEQRTYKHTLQYHDKHDRYALTARDMRRDTEQEKEKRRKIYQRAVEFFDKALQLDPKNAYAAQGIAIALVDDKKDYSSAVQILSKVKDSLKDASIYLNLGHVYAELRQYSRSIEHYEAALAKDRARDVQILACLGRVWLARGKQEHSLAAMKTALDYAQRAQSIAPDQLHLQFNVAFVQNQIAQLAYGLEATQKTLQDVQEAADGLKEAIETFQRLSEEKNPPYPSDALKQRANMGGTITKQLDRAMQNQKEYEEKNAAKLQQAREIREAAQKKREEELRKAQEIEQERKNKIAAERAQMVEDAQRRAMQRAEAERAREAAELTDDSVTGEKVKRKKKPTSKRKKKGGDDFIAPDDEGDHDGASRRRLERRSGGKATASQGKFKSSEIVVDSDDEDVAATPGDNKDDLFGEDEKMQDEDVSAPRRRNKASRRIDDDEDEDEEDAAPVLNADNQDDDEDDLFGDKAKPAEDAEMQNE